MDKRTVQPWWTWEVAGFVTAVIGVLVLVKPGNSLEALAVITGIYLLLDSAFAFYRAIAGSHEDEGEPHELPLVHAVTSLVIGLLLVRHPVQSLKGIAILIAIWLLAVGCLRTVAGLRSTTHRAARVALGLVQALAGIVVIAAPQIGYSALTIVAGLALLLQGLGMLALGFQVRESERAAHELT